MRFFLTLLTLLFILDASKVYAQRDDIEAEPTKKLETMQYSPEYCRFSASFPEEPYITKRCEKEDDEASCYNLISYTKVFDVASTVNVEIICNPATPEMYEHFNEKTMDATIREMTKDSTVQIFKVNTAQKDGYRIANLIGKGNKGTEETIYISQLWVAEDSIMSIEAQMRGAPNIEADQLFAEILNGIGYLQPEKPENKETSPQPESP